MLRLRNPACRRLLQQLLCAAVVCCSPVPVWLLSSSPLEATPAGNKGKTPQPPTVRWSEQQPGCTFSEDNDGKYRYGLWSGDVGVVLAVDAREVQIIRRRIEPIFGVLLEIHYRGTGSLDTSADGITLQFMKHFKVVQTSLDPGNYSEKIQADADASDDDTRRKVAKHPEQKQVLEASLQDRQKSYNELIDFLGKNSLRRSHLDRANPDVSGWVFFSTSNKWLGKWKAQEEFVLRVPLDGKIFEFPFKLPPKQGELLLQKRE
jgi:hypothetical protein